MFIIFNTLNQAKNYIKRHPNRYFNEGCGCCYSATQFYIKDNKVLCFNLNSYAGNISTDCVVLGKIKLKVGSSAPE